MTSKARVVPGSSRALGYIKHHVEIRDNVVLYRRGQKYVCHY